MKWLQHIENEQIQKGVLKPKLMPYNQYKFSTKSTLSNAEEAIDFNNFYECIYLGYILAPRKLI